VLQLRSNGVSSNDLDATADDFEQYFAQESTDLLRLSLHLTGDAETAERCRILARRDCNLRSRVSKHRVRTWARLMVILNAIRLVCGIRSDLVSESGLEFHLQSSDYPVEALRESVAILALPDFDRLALVICVLERYAILDCAFLLRKTPLEVYKAILGATDRVVSVDRRKKDNDAAASSANSYGSLLGEQNCFEN